MSDFRMPTLGADMEAGTLVEWLKHPGDAVRRGDIIAVVETQKGAIEIEVFEDGVLEETFTALGEKVPVGTVLARIGHTAAVGATVEPDSRPSAQPAVAAAVSAADAAPRVRVSPAARKLAADLALDLTPVKGTGAEGAITREDVEREAALKASPSAAAGAAASKERGHDMRRAIAAAMARSKREIPHYYLSTTIDLSRMMTWLRVENERRSMEERLLPAVLLLKAVALSVRETPALNGRWMDGSFRPAANVHLGCAITLKDGGLIAPALHDVDRLDLSTLMHRLRDLVARARAGSLRSSELMDATLTVTNLGEQGVDSAFGIIYPPQVALVGFGVIAERPWAENGRIDARPLITTTLAADHRASDGHTGARFLSRLGRLLQAPEGL